MNPVSLVSFENPEEMRSLGINKYEDFGRMASEAERSRFRRLREPPEKHSEDLNFTVNSRTSTFDGFVETLIEDELMQERQPPIARGARPTQVEELRNVRVKAYIFATVREDDNDYHVILGNSILDLTCFSMLKFQFQRVWPLSPHSGRGKIPVSRPSSQMICQD